MLHYCLNIITNAYAMLWCVGLPDSMGWIHLYKLSLWILMVLYLLLHTDNSWQACSILLAFTSYLCSHKDVLLIVKEQRNILHEIRKRKTNWIGHILRRNCLLQWVTEGKIQGEIEVTGRQGRRHRKLWDDLKEKSGYSHLKEEALDCTMWRARFGRGFGPVVRQTTKWMNERNMYSAIIKTGFGLRFAFYASSTPPSHPLGACLWGLKPGIYTKSADFGPGRAALAGLVAPSQPSGSLKPTAMDLDMSEPTVSSETANRRMSSDMSGPLSDMPDGATHNAQVNNTCLPAGERPNKTPIFISGFCDTRAFLAWLQASCPGSLTAQLKSEKLMVVPSTADRFRAAVSALRSLDGRESVSFHTFTLPEDCCVRLLVKNLGRGMPESVVREEMEFLNNRVQGITQLRSGRRDQDPAKDRPPTSHFIVSVARGSEVSKVQCLTEFCSLRVSVELYVAPKGPLQCKRCQLCFGRFPAHHQELIDCSGSLCLFYIIHNCLFYILW
jgi:hypothetical protein